MGCQQHLPPTTRTGGHPISIAQSSHTPHRHTKDVLARLARIEGHVRAVKGMVEQDRNCPDVLIQLAAIRSAIEQVSKLVLADHVESCLRGAATSGEAEAEWASLKEALDRFIA